MTLGAFVDAGVPFDYLKKRLALLDLSGWDIKIEDVKKSGIGARFVSVLDLAHHEHSHDHSHNHSHDHQHNLEHSHDHSHDHDQSHSHEHRGWGDIRRLILASGLSEGEKSLSIAIFKRIAEAEAEAHRVEIDSVHFHEVGAIDSIIDIVGSAIGFLYLKKQHSIEAVYSKGTNLGGGTVWCAHGEMPVPAPATSAILRSVPVWSSGEFEMTTPTGAAILAELTDSFSLPAGYSIIKSGVGAGKREASLPNMLRVFIGSFKESSVADGSVIQIEALIDDMTPEALSHAQKLFLEEGALESILVGANNKGRDCSLLRVLVESNLFSQMVELIFKESTTIGVRYYPVSRKVLSRSEFLASGVTIKESSLEGGVVINRKPQFSELEELAKRDGRTLKSVMQDGELLKEFYSKREDS